MHMETFAVALAVVPNYLSSHCKGYLLTVATARKYISKVSTAISLILKAGGTMPPCFLCMALLEIRPTEGRRGNIAAERNKTPLVLGCGRGEQHSGFGWKKHVICSNCQLHG